MVPLLSFLLPLLLRVPPLPLPPSGFPRVFREIRVRRRPAHAFSRLRPMIAGGRRRQRRRPVMPLLARFGALKASATLISGMRVFRRRPRRSRGYSRSRCRRSSKCSEGTVEPGLGGHLKGRRGLTVAPKRVCQQLWPSRSQKGVLLEEPTCELAELGAHADPLPFPLIESRRALHRGARAYHQEKKHTVTVAHDEEGMALRHLWGRRGGEGGWGDM